MNWLDQLYHRVAKPVLFRMDAERAHNIIAGLLKHSGTVPGSGWFWERLLGYASPRLASQVCGLDFPNPLGMAAGFDKTGGLYPFLSRMGFGFVECGTFSAHGQPGNPQPRLFRFPEEQALVNRMGFNNPGSAAGAKTLARQSVSVPRGVNIGKSKITPIQEATADYLQSLERFEADGLADYFAVNVSSPNTPGLRKLQGKEHMTELLGTLCNRLRELAKGRVTEPTPLFVKVAPDLSLPELDAILEALTDAGASGIIVSNTTIDKSSVPAAKDHEGGLSGPAVRARSTELIQHCRETLGPEAAIIGVGGINTGAHALEKLLAGANLVQVYTGYVYEGPGQPAAINRYLDRVLEGAQLQLSDLVARGQDSFAELDALAQ